MSVLTKNLQLGAVGDDVKMLQRRLNELGYFGADGKPLVVDGIFGPNTLHGVNGFKNAHLPGGNIGVNEGVVGQQTWSTLLSVRMAAPAPTAGAGTIPLNSKLALDQISANNRIFANRDGDWSIQAKGWYFSSGYPTRNVNSTSTNTSSHGGVDIAGVPEGTPIYSTFYGLANKLTQIDNATGKATGWGRYIRVDTIINDVPVSLFYAHMSGWAVETGALVEPGTVLGYIGHTGTVIGNPGDHLHFEVRMNNKHVNPYPYLMNENLT